MLALLGGACSSAGVPGYPCVTAIQSSVIQIATVDSLDLLLVIDDSPAMADQQAHLRDQIARAITTLATGQRDMAHGGNFTPPRSMHVGIVGSTMGLGPIMGVPGCPSGFGDDGILRTQCAAMAVTRDACSLPRETCPAGVFEFRAGQDAMGRPTAVDFASDVSCVASIGTGGCELEYLLEAGLKALAPAPRADGSSSVIWTAPGYIPPTFAGGTLGHGNDPATNGGFLRRDSVLAILTFGNEDDCSTDHPEIFSPSDPRYTGVELNVRCVAFAGQLFPVARYVDGLIGLRRQPSLLVFGAITGIPSDLSPGPGVRTDATLLNRLLADPRMQPMIDPMHPARLVPVCTSTMGGHTAAPGRRMVEVAQGLLQHGATVTVHSICEDDLSSIIDEIVDKLSQALRGGCLARALVADRNGMVACDVVEVLPADGDVVHCADLPHPEAYTLVSTESVRQSDGTTLTREVCRVRQVGRAGAAADTPGWAYDDGNPALGAFSQRPTGCSQRIAFTSMISPGNGAEVRMRCTAEIFPSVPPGAPSIGDLCDPSTGSTTTPSGPMPCSNGHARRGHDATLRCDTFSLTCQMPCTTDADCPSAGLLGASCDLHTAAEYFGGASSVPMGIASTARRGFCADPCAMSSP